jgi:hypothetical protein
MGLFDFDLTIKSFSHPKFSPGGPPPPPPMPGMGLFDFGLVLKELEYSSNPFSRRSTTTTTATWNGFV